MRKCDFSVNGIALQYIRHTNDHIIGDNILYLIRKLTCHTEIQHCEYIRHYEVDMNVLANVTFKKEILNDAECLNFYDCSKLFLTLYFKKFPPNLLDRLKYSLCRFNYGKDTVIFKNGHNEAVYFIVSDSLKYLYEKVLKYVYYSLKGIPTTDKFNIESFSDSGGYVYVISGNDRIRVEVSTEYQDFYMGYLKYIFTHQPITVLQYYELSKEPVKMYTNNQTTFPSCQLITNLFSSYFKNAHECAIMTRKEETLKLVDIAITELIRYNAVSQSTKEYFKLKSIQYTNGYDLPIEMVLLSGEEIILQFDNTDQRIDVFNLFNSFVDKGNIGILCVSVDFADENPNLVKCCLEKVFGINFTAHQIDDYMEYEGHSKLFTLENRKYQPIFTGVGNITVSELVFG